MNTDFNKGEDIMKKTIAFVASLLIAGSAMGMTAFAEENDTVSSVKTYVTIADKEKNTPLDQKEVTVTDIDETASLISMTRSTLLTRKILRAELRQATRLLQLSMVLLSRFSGEQTTATAMATM